MRLLELKGYDIIFGCDWIYEYSPISINLKKREMSICKDNRNVVFIDETIPGKHYIVECSTLGKLLQK